MLTLTGRLIDVVRSQSTDPQSGEVTQVAAAEILHKERGKSVVESLKFDVACEAGWRKFQDKEITVEVRMYAMKGNSGNIQSGLALADKKAYPSLFVPAVVAPVGAPALKAA